MTLQGIPVSFVRIKPQSIWERDQQNFRVCWDYLSKTQWIEIDELVGVLDNFKSFEPVPDGCNYTVVIRGL